MIILPGVIFCSSRLRIDGRRCEHSHTRFPLLDSRGCGTLRMGCDRLQVGCTVETFLLRGFRVCVEGLLSTDSGRLRDLNRNTRTMTMRNRGNRCARRPRFHARHRAQYPTTANRGRHRKSRTFRWIQSIVSLSGLVGYHHLRAFLRWQRA